MALMTKLLGILRGYRKLIVALLTLFMAIFMFGITLVLLIKAYINGGQFVESLQALGSLISTVVVAYMGTNMAKHLLDAGKESIQQWVEKRKK